MLYNPTHLYYKYINRIIFKFKIYEKINHILQVLIRGNLRINQKTL